VADDDDSGRAAVDVNTMLLDLFSRVTEHVDTVVRGLDAAALCASPEPGANSIAWLVWHLARVQDHYVSGFLGEAQVWETGGWAGRFGLEPDPHNSGYGHSASDAAAVRPDGPDALTGYYGAVVARTNAYVAELTDDALDQIVDRSYDPPVTLAARLVSMADDDLQHVGQAAYARGLLQRR
jgi:hypothetical protein